MSDADELPPELTPDQALEKLNEIHEFDEKDPEPWRAQLAKDLNHLVGRACWWLETDRDEIDTHFGIAVLRTVQRVAEFENLKPMGKPKS